MLNMHHHRLARRIFALFFLACLIGGTSGIGVATAATSQKNPLPTTKPIDLVVVLKSDRTMYLYRNGLPVYQFDIALGEHPIGDKVHAGDERTPEGAYILDWRNPDSIYYKSIHISYPNAEDVREAARRGVDPGGMIMIHGQPDYAFEKRTGDWTNGCIAVSNHAMDIIWRLVPVGTPIHILP